MRRDAPGRRSSSARTAAARSGATHGRRRPPRRASRASARGPGSRPRRARRPRRRRCRPRRRTATARRRGRPPRRARGRDRACGTRTRRPARAGTPATCRTGRAAPRRAFTASTCARVSSPRPTPDWLDTTPSRTPRARRSSSTAGRPPGAHRRRVAVVRDVVHERAVAVEQDRSERRGHGSSPRRAATAPATRCRTAANGMAALVQAMRRSSGPNTSSPGRGPGARRRPRNCAVRAAHPSAPSTATRGRRATSPPTPTAAAATVATCHARRPRPVSARSRHPGPCRARNVASSRVPACTRRLTASSAGRTGGSSCACRAGAPSPPRARAARGPRPRGRRGEALVEPADLLERSAPVRHVGGGPRRALKPGGPALPVRRTAVRGQRDVQAALHAAGAGRRRREVLREQARPPGGELDVVVEEHDPRRGRRAPPGVARGGRPRPPVRTTRAERTAGVPEVERVGHRVGRAGQRQPPVVRDDDLGRPGRVPAVGLGDEGLQEPVERRAADRGTTTAYGTGGAGRPAGALTPSPRTEPRTRRAAHEVRAEHERVHGADPKSSSASRGSSTIGRPAVLRLVLTTTGSPVSSLNARIVACSRGVDPSTVWMRAVPSTCTTAAIRSRHAGATSCTNSMYGLGTGPPEKISAASSSRTIGATGRNCSRPFTSLSRSRFSTGPGCASRERCPSARGRARPGRRTTPRRRRPRGSARPRRAGRRAS